MQPLDRECEKKGVVRNFKQTFNNTERETAEGLWTHNEARKIGEYDTYSTHEMYKKKKIQIKYLNSGISTRKKNITSIT